MYKYNHTQQMHEEHGILQGIERTQNTHSPVQKIRKLGPLLARRDEDLYTDDK